MIPGRPQGTIAVAYTAAAGTAVALPKGTWFLITSSTASWAQFGATGVAPTAKTAPAFLVGPWATYVRRPDATPGSQVGPPTHINSIRDAADGTLSVVGLD